MTRIQSIAWETSAGKAIGAAQLGDNITADLVIVGGGFTGCSTALHAASQGMKVCLLEARTIGYGGSGRNAGLVNAGLWTPPGDVEDLLGKEPGSKLNGILAAAPDLVFCLIEEHSIECGAVRNGTLHCAHSASGYRDLERRYSQLKQRDAPVTLIDAEETKRRTGSAVFKGALFDPRAGTINPLAYCRGLARAAAVKSARIFEQSEATAIERDGGFWVVRTSKGSVSAKSLLIATNGYTLPAKGMPSTEQTTVDYCQFATAPLNESKRRSITPGCEGCWDTAQVMSSFRLDSLGRLIIGGIGSLEHRAARLHVQWARGKLAELFPELAGEPFVDGWSGHIAMTRDHLPKVLRLDDNGYAVFGYSGRGIAPGTVFGKALARAFATGEQTELPIQPTITYSEPFRTARQVWIETGALAAHTLHRLRNLSMTHK